MAEYTIPKSQRPLFDKLRLIPESILRELVSALERSPFTVPAVSDLSPSDTSDVKDAIMELHRVREYFDAAAPKFADIAIALQEVVEFPVAEVPAFEERLAGLLAISPLAVASKALPTPANLEGRKPEDHVPSYFAEDAGCHRTMGN